MDVQPLAIDGALQITPRQHGDDRGVFMEWFRHDHLSAALGYSLDLAQANCSVSSRGTMRGVHFADVPPGQAKYVTCVRGVVLDAVVDIRVGSPTFGRSEIVRLDEDTRRAVYLPEGMGHAFFALTDDATVVYLCSTTYNPTGEHGLHPLDPELAIAWPDDLEPLLSPKDAAAPSLAEALASGLLPDYATCRAYDEELRRAASARA